MSARKQLQRSALFLREWTAGSSCADCRPATRAAVVNLSYAELAREYSSLKGGSTSRQKQDAESGEKCGDDPVGVAIRQAIAPVVESTDVFRCVVDFGVGSLAAEAYRTQVYIDFAQKNIAPATCGSRTHATNLLKRHHAPVDRRLVACCKVWPVFHVILGHHTCRHCSVCRFVLLGILHLPIQLALTRSVEPPGCSSSADRAQLFLFFLSIATSLYGSRRSSPTRQRLLKASLARSPLRQTSRDLQRVLGRLSSVCQKTLT